ncbi:peptidogalycan biosysnthesis protein [Bacteriovorax sp. PP10]|uniref:Peptidogalycan biosysnthesis protein n=1 Tax=Bacteriovorax antarcticus TaxID=3088717 RepID=A0ABU5W0H2_9BACT|nr:peptidogalycan biosysnthesis protein [Bacteriovorax sp. PP10]MEA9357330.1 peptidogalycan biosysnthesis protein [Bacteriovorax sp. PP10]
MINKPEWILHQPQTNPFLNFEFLNALMQSGSVKTETGWTPAFTRNDSGILMSFIKTHSYGEYIFDWGWAEAFEKYGIPYYPKLTSLLPFTPVTTQHFLMKSFDENLADALLKAHDDFFMKNDFSSTHFLFLTNAEIPLFQKNNYLIRESIQYHFFNPGYKSFEDFLSKLKSKKAKHIRTERSYDNLSIKRYTGDELTKEHADRMYQFYISTIVNKNSFDYLNAEFFELIFKNLSKNILYVEASQNNFPIAGSLFFYDSEKLYGRYWGSTSYVENLHFELCYYQGIDFCIENSIAVFEAGAQGEHKIARGFRPVRTYSAHKIKHPAFQNAIAEFIETEKVHVEQSILKLSEHLPFKNI